MQSIEVGPQIQTGAVCQHHGAVHLLLEVFSLLVPTSKATFYIDAC